MHAKKCQIACRTSQAVATALQRAASGSGPELKHSCISPVCRPEHSQKFSSGEHGPRQHKVQSRFQQLAATLQPGLLLARLIFQIPLGNDCGGKERKPAIAADNVVASSRGTGGCKVVGESRRHGLGKRLHLQFSCSTKDASIPKIPSK